MFSDKTGELNGLSAVKAVNMTLRRIDERLIDHGERVAFIACELCEAGNIDIDIKTLFLLSIFHDIGAYKTDEIDRMVEFETQNVQNHSIYGYLFLKYLTPLKDSAKAILYHHYEYEDIPDDFLACQLYAGLIHLADRIDILSHYGSNSEQFKMLCSNSNRLFSEHLLSVFINCYKSRQIFERLADSSYAEANLARISSFNISSEEALEYIKMIIFSIDFRSEHTVTHTINTVSIALNIAGHFNISQAERNEIYLGALLHDAGKIAIPIDILESSGKLSFEQMEIMKTHVTETQRLITDIVSKEVLNIAIRHHEKLDGSGYPYGIGRDELSFCQRIVAVADVVSALCGKRSYKEPFNKQQIMNILNDMKGEQLDESICDYVCEYYDEIMLETDNSRNEVIQNYLAMNAEYDQLSKTI